MISRAARNPRLFHPGIAAGEPTQGKVFAPFSSKMISRQNASG